MLITKYFPISPAENLVFGHLKYAARSKTYEVQLDNMDDSFFHARIYLKFGEMRRHILIFSPLAEKVINQFHSWKPQLQSSFKRRCSVEQKNGQISCEAYLIPFDLDEHYSPRQCCTTQRRLQLSKIICFLVCATSICACFILITSHPKLYNITRSQLFHTSL